MMNQRLPELTLANSKSVTLVGVLVGIDNANDK